ncbi:unnamed protein product [Gordionus sp. m RMFG-2023]
MSTLLEYESQLFLDCYHDDGLLILAKGLGINRIFLNFLKLYLDHENLVIILNSSHLDVEYFIDKLKEDGEMFLPKIINNETSSQKRSAIYLEGGVLFVSTRIFIVDMLTEIILIPSITGILVYNAHKIAGKCQEVFALKIFRETNKIGFIKAFSDVPQAFNKGFLSLENVMKRLFLRHLHLWPRFHSSIILFLENHKPNVIEIQIKPTKLMNEIQISIIELIQLCIKVNNFSLGDMNCKEMTKMHALKN